MSKYTQEELNGYSPEALAKLLAEEGKLGFEAIFDELYTVKELRGFAEKFKINLKGRDKKGDIIETVTEWASAQAVVGDVASDDTEEDSDGEGDDLPELGGDSQPNVTKEHPYVSIVEEHFGGKLVQYDETDQGVIVFEVEGTEVRGTLLELYQSAVAGMEVDLSDEDVALLVKAVSADLVSLHQSVTQAVALLSRELDESRARIDNLEKALKCRGKDDTLHGSIDNLSV